MGSADVVIVGGGVIGSSIGYHIKRSGSGRVVIVERDDTYARASSRLAMGGVRQQFTLPANVRLAQYSVGFYRDVLPRLQSVGSILPEGGPRRRYGPVLHQRGYLFLVDDEQSARFEERFAAMCGAGANVVRLSRDDVQAMLPDAFLDDIRFAVFGPEDGYVDAEDVLARFRLAAASLGVDYVRAEVTNIQRRGDRVAAVEMGTESISTPLVVNAAGPHADQVAHFAGVWVPVYPVRQQLFRCALPKAWPYRFPMVVDPDGLHWRHDDSEDGGPDRIITARTRHDERPGENFVCDQSRWLADFYPDLVRRMPAFTDVQLVEGWAGLYEMTPDRNPVLGEHPDLRGFYLANGFSGHGLMMAPAVGKAISELVLHGSSRTIDISDFAIERFARGRPLTDAATI